ncbi:hypothetical protein [Streptomyces sp. ME19-01-6]|uniref:hypothetical protein n=1 Tax=Streptomyces sp. ME19-01-6 TaxID=3028686 RepID=UPI0029B7C45E|nr:hypothetical protein [Streptomyces sp. ME19-01-6]MDX3224759.1 hypothetical protein [Streptomyces sp. ME19-01-6]
MSDFEPDYPTVFVGLHGVFHRRPWIARLHAEEGIDEDVFSLAVKRAEAYGWTTTSGGVLEGARWGHNDAGEDWTEDGRIRQMAWLQIAAENPRGQRLPVLPAATVLGDVLRRMGTFRLTGLHTLAPLHLAPDSLVHLAQTADWFALDDPDGAVEFTVTVSGRGSAASAVESRDVRALALERAFGRLTFEAVPPGPDTQEGLALPVAGEVQTEGMRQVLALRCGARSWSLDTAVWATEIVIDALRAAGAAQPVLVTVSGPASA